MQNTRYGLIDRVLNGKTNSTEDLYKFCVMMFNSNKEKYQTIDKIKNLDDKSLQILEQQDNFNKETEDKIRSLFYLFGGLAILYVVVVVKILSI